VRRWLFTGWTVVAGAFFGYAIAQGLMHSYAVFLVAYLGEFGWGRAETSVAYSVSQLVIGISSPLIGALVDRLGTRVLVTAGAVLLAGGLAANATVSSLWQVVLLYGVVMTLGSNCLGLVVSRSRYSLGGSCGDAGSRSRWCSPPTASGGPRPLRWCSS